MSHFQIGFLNFARRFATLASLTAFIVTAAAFAWGQDFISDGPIPYSQSPAQTKKTLPPKPASAPRVNKDAQALDSSTKAVPATSTGYRFQSTAPIQEVSPNAPAAVQQNAAPASGATSPSSSAPQSQFSNGNVRYAPSAMTPASGQNAVAPAATAVQAPQPASAAVGINPNAMPVPPAPATSPQPANVFYPTPLKSDSSSPAAPVSTVAPSMAPASPAGTPSPASPAANLPQTAPAVIHYQDLPPGANLFDHSSVQETGVVTQPSNGAASGAGTVAPGANPASGTGTESVNAAGMPVVAPSGTPSTTVPQAGAPNVPASLPPTSGTVAPNATGTASGVSPQPVQPIANIAAPVQGNGMLSVVPLAPNGTSSATDIALILPFKSPEFAGASESVMNGFAAGARDAALSDRVSVVQYRAGDVVNAYNQAIALGAKVIVGPLTRDDLRVLAQTNPQVWTIALTQLDDPNAVLPPKVLSFAFSIESDARLLARRIASMNAVNPPALLSTETPLMKRFCDAFVDEWSKMGKTTMPSRILFSPDSLADLASVLNDTQPSAVVLAVDGGNASLARAQTNAWPTYASGLIYQKPLKFEGYLFDQMRVVDVPWLIRPNAPEFAALGEQPQMPSSARLYALGFDAFRVAEAFVNGQPQQLDFFGASGVVHYDPQSGLSRYGQLGIFSKGQLQPLGGAAAGAEH